MAGEPGHARLDLRCLGPIEVRDAAGPRSLAGRRIAALLAIFLSRPNQSISADELIEGLWEGRPPASAETALRVHVTNLRRVLEPRRPRASPSVRLPVSPPGYRLRVDPDELDAQRFERLVVAARQRWADGDAAGTARAHEVALGTWRGAAFGEARDLSFLRPEAARLDELRATATSELAEAQLAMGDHAAVIELMQRAIADDPLREVLTAHLMVALYRAGRQVEALDAFSKLRTQLVEGLGVEPSTELRGLEGAILRQEPELDWRPAPSRPAGALERAPVVRELTERTLIGRGEEMDVLEAAWDVAKSGRRQLVLVHGEPGVGKTSLVDDFATRTAREATVVRGCCDPEPLAALQPFIEALDSLLPTEELHRLLPELHGSPPAIRAPGVIDPSAERYRLFEGIALVLRQAAAEQAVLVVLEDMHWAHRSAQLLLDYLTRRPDESSLLFLVTVRETDLARKSPLGKALARARTDEGGARIALRGLDERDVELLLHATAPPSLLADLIPLVPAVREVTDGNPLFVKEMVQTLVEQRPVLDDRTVRSIAPAGVRDLIRQRFAHLSDDAAKVANAGSVSEREFTLGVVARATGFDDEDVLPLVEELLAAGLVQESPSTFDRFGFTHPVVRNAVYEDLTRSRRARLHRDVGCAIEELTGASNLEHAAELAHHFFEVLPIGELEPACRYSRLAGDQALQRLDYEQAVGLYERVLEICSDLSDRDVAAITLRLGAALEGSRRLDDARTAYAGAADLGRKLGDARIIADAAIASSVPWASTTETNRTLVPLLEEALAAPLTSETEDLRRRVHLFSGLATALHYYDQRREKRLAQDALELARVSEDPESLAAALDAWHRFLNESPAHTDQRIAISREMMQLSQLAGLAEHELRGQRNLLYDLLELGALENFGNELDSYERHATEHRRPMHIWWAAALRATQALARGECDAAEQLSESALTAGDQNEQIEAPGTYGIQALVLSFQRGQLEAMRPMFESQPATGSVSVYWAVHAALMATIYAEMGNADGVGSQLERARPQGFAGIPRNSFWLLSVSLLCGAAADVGRIDDAEVLAEMLRPFLGKVVVFGAGAAILGFTDHWLGVYAAAAKRWDEACELFDRSGRRCGALGADYWRAEDEVGLACALRGRDRAGDNVRARALARGVRSEAKRAGWGRLVRGCDAVLE